MSWFDVVAIDISPKVKKIILRFVKYVNVLLEIIWLIHSLFYKTIAAGDMTYSIGVQLPVLKDLKNKLRYQSSMYQQTLHAINFQSLF